MNNVRPKKYLGQHFLKDASIASRVIESLSLKGYDQVLEVGPGMGVLTQFLVQLPIKTYAIEIDKESVAYLHTHYPQLEGCVYEADFLREDVVQLMGNKPFALVGNFPYNISSQILLKALEHRSHIPEFCGMFQREVAERICAGPGSKTYGILSVLAQAFYNAHYLFTVSEHVFVPPPKVKSAVIHLQRRPDFHLPCDETLFFKLVKAAFNQRRKTLRNSLKSFTFYEDYREDAIFGQRAEQLSVAQFVKLTQSVRNDSI